LLLSLDGFSTLLAFNAATKNVTEIAAFDRGPCSCKHERRFTHGGAVAAGEALRRSDGSTLCGCTAPAWPKQAQAAQVFEPKCGIIPVQKPAQPRFFE
jgi:hypothetical protein